MQKIIAVIGCGRIASGAHFPALSKMEDVTIKYACDLIPEKAQKLADQYGAQQVITDYHIALNDPEVQTRSSGEGALKHVVILKRKD